MSLIGAIACPKIYKSVYPDEPVDWAEDDAGIFSSHDEQLLRSIEEDTGTSAELLMKLLEVEVSMSGLAKRRGLLDKLKPSSLKIGPLWRLCKKNEAGLMCEACTKPN